MFKNKNADGTLNLCGKNIARLRLNLGAKVSQKGLADRLQIAGLDLDKNVIQKIESGQRFVTNIELYTLAKVLNVSVDDLLQ